MLNTVEKKGGSWLIAVYILLGSVAAIVLFYATVALFVNPRKEYETDSHFYRKLLIVTTVVAVRLLRIHVHTSGLERIPPDTHCLFVSNHRSNYDPILTWYVFRDRAMAFIAKPSLFHLPAFGRIIRRCRFMPIDRDSARNAMKTFARAQDLLASQELSVGVYPEGTRCKTGEMLPFHNGVFRIAQKAEVPVVVLALSDTRTIARNVPFRASYIRLDVVDVILPEEMQGVRAHVVGDRARKAIEQQLKQEEC